MKKTRRTRKTIKLNTPFKVLANGTNHYVFEKLEGYAVEDRVRLVEYAVRDGNKHVVDIREYALALIIRFLDDRRNLLVKLVA